MSLIIQTTINTHFNSNTYLIKNSANDTACYLIDIGNHTGIVEALEKKEYIKGIFLTHAHYDHICGINEILKKFPHCIIFCSEYTKKALLDSKLNLSFYHEAPITYKGKNVKIIKEGDAISLFENVMINILETPGHNAGSLSFKINQAFFTGDSLIPKIPVVTKLKSGNKLDAKNSIIKIKKSTTDQTIIYPGHGNSVEILEMDWDFFLKEN